MADPVRLTQLAKRAGCAAKQPPGYLFPLLKSLPAITDPNVLTNDKAQPGDVLILTKPLGLGIITTAAKNGEDKLGAITAAIQLMTTLNRAAAEAIVGVGAHALTDITGFGLLGHLRNIVAA